MGSTRALLAGLALAAVGTDTRAAGGTMTDQAVSLSYGATHWGGGQPVADFAGTEPVGATDIVYESGWWYRVNGLDTRERPLPAPTSEAYLGPEGGMEWLNLDGRGFDVLEAVKVFDRELPSGAYTSRLWIRNNTGAPLDISVFHYLDADADAASASTTGVALTPEVLGFDGSATVGLYRGRGSVAYKVHPYPGLRNLLNDTSLTNLDSSLPTFGPGDWTAAFQWNVIVPPSGSGAAYPLADVVVSSRVLPRQKGDLLPNANPDILFWNESLGRALACDMRRTTCVDSAILLESERVPVAVDDFHATLRQDVVLRDQLSGQVFFKDPFGTTTPLSGALPLPLNWKLSATADFDHDARPDILWRNTSSQKLVIWTMAGTVKAATLVPSPDQAVNSNWEVVGAQDYDNDGNTDLLWYNATSGKIVVWRMDALVQRISGDFTSPPNAGDNNWRVVATADFGMGPSTTGTAVYGTPDLLWRNATSGNLVVWHMNFALQRTSGVFTTPAGLEWTVVGPR